MKKKGHFQHSSFLAGGATLSAGRMVVNDGILKAVWPHSGHYHPTEQAFMSFLRENNVDLTNTVQMRKMEKLLLRSRGCLQESERPKKKHVTFRTLRLVKIHTLKPRIFRSYKH